MRVTPNLPSWNHFPTAQPQSSPAVVSALDVQKTPAQSGIAPPTFKPDALTTHKEQVPALAKESSRHEGLSSSRHSNNYQRQQREPAPRGVVPNRHILSIGEQPQRHSRQSTGLLRLFSGSANKVCGMEQSRGARASADQGVCL